MLCISRFVVPSRMNYHDQVLAVFYNTIESQLLIILSSRKQNRLSSFTTEICKKSLLANRRYCNNQFSQGVKSSKGFTTFSNSSKYKLLPISLYTSLISSIPF